MVLVVGYCGIDCGSLWFWLLMIVVLVVGACCFDCSRYGFGSCGGDVLLVVVLLSENVGVIVDVC